MIHFSRLGTLTVIAGGMLSIPLVYAGGADLHPAASSTELLLSNPSQGFLGVVIRDVDNDRASALKLKDPHGAEIISIDQDAPASKAGLKVHDVVVQMNGQRVEGIEQFRRMLRETPPGRTVSLVVMRDGQALTLSAQLGDRAQIATQMIGDLNAGPTKVFPGDDGDLASGSLGGSSQHRSSHSYGFLEPFNRNRYYVGIEVERLPSGLADYFGVKNGSGLLIGSVFPNTPAATAGLKAADVIQKVNGQPIVSLSDWERAIRLNHGKQMQVLVIRDKKEQTVTMVAGESKTSSQLDLPDLPDGQLLAEQLRSQVAGMDAAALADQIQQALPGIDAEGLGQEAEDAVRSFDSKQLQKALELNQEQWMEDQKQIQRQMDDLKPQLQSIQPEQMD